jgi:hypothetical protein
MAGELLQSYHGSHHILPHRITPSIHALLYDMRFTSSEIITHTSYELSNLKNVYVLYLNQAIDRAYDAYKAHTLYPELQCE